MSYRLRLRSASAIVLVTDKTHRVVQAKKWPSKSIPRKRQTATLKRPFTCALPGSRKLSVLIGFDTLGRKLGSCTPGSTADTVHLVKRASATVAAPVTNWNAMAESLNGTAGKTARRG